jgi:hypothetical protein
MITKSSLFARGLRALAVVTLFTAVSAVAQISSAVGQMSFNFSVPESLTLNVDTPTVALTDAGGGQFQGIGNVTLSWNVATARTLSVNAWVPTAASSVQGDTATTEVELDGGAYNVCSASDCGAPYSVPLARGQGTLSLPVHINVTPSGSGGFNAGDYSGTLYLQATAL